VKDKEVIKRHPSISVENSYYATELLSFCEIYCSC